MKTLETTWARLGFESPAVVERMLVRGAFTGAAVAALGTLLLLQGWLSPRDFKTFAVTSTALLLIFGLPRQPLAARAGICAGAVVAALFCPFSVAALPYFFTVPLGLALATEASTPARKLAAFAGPSLGAAWSGLVAGWLSARHAGVASALSWLVLPSAGLFISAGAALAWATFATDTVEPRLAGDPKLSAAWHKLRAALRKLPRGQARARLDALANEGAQRCVKALAERDELVRTIDSTLEQDSRDAVSAIEARLEETNDVELRQHLAQLLRVHRDTLEQFDGLRRKVERLDARVAAETGWLETAAFSVELAPRTDSGFNDLHARLTALSPSPCEAR